MNINQFDYPLPPELIAQYPLAERNASRLLCYDSVGDHCVESRFADLGRFVEPGDLLVVNDTRVLPARIDAHKPSGGKVEIMLERQLEENRLLVQLRSNKTIKSGQTLLVGAMELLVSARQGRFFIMELPDDVQAVTLFQQYGAMPLPPYIKREANAEDLDRYQTVFAEKLGAVAAPTAGLHFDQQLIDQLEDKGVGWESITLHVGAGTFLPVQTENLEQHVMHSEWISVSSRVCDSIHQVKQNGGKVIAIGTTVARALESASSTGQVNPYHGETQLFIKPGFRFHTVDKLVTNFHLPKSTLLVLVSAFAGYHRIMSMYQYAVANEFRFFSYGDAMMLERSDEI